MEILYMATATAVGGRNGHVKSSDGVIDMELKTPVEMGGTGGAATNPEQLFAAGYAACFSGALNLAAKLKHIRTGEVSVKVDVGIGKEADGGLALSVAIEATVPGVDQKVAEELVSDAHGICPYAKATKGNIATTIKTKAV